LIGIEFLKNILKQVQARGLLTTTKYAIYRMDEPIRVWKLGIRSAMEATDVYISRSQLGYTDKPDFRAYEPSLEYYPFRKIMDRFICPCGEDVFLDFGSGLGRVVIMAATFPFKRVIGVEYSQKLYSRASELTEEVKPRLRCKTVELVKCDAATYDLPKDVNVFFFSIPFVGETLERVMRNIEKSVTIWPRKIKIIYYHPREFEKSIKWNDWLVKLADVQFPELYIHRIAIFENCRIPSG
jgi:SAM-dependent methyltransferase